MPFVYTDLFVSTDLGQSNPLVTTPRRVYVLRHRSRCRVLSTAITVSHRLSSRPLNFPLTHSLFVGECKVSGTTFFTPRAAWSLPRFQLVRLASVSIATVQASIPQSGPRLRFGATPLVPCPFAFQPNLDSVRCVAEQTLMCLYLNRERGPLVKIYHTIQRQKCYHYRDHVSWLIDLIDVLSLTNHQNLHTTC